jgi:hypothetical protein
MLVMAIFLERQWRWSQEFDKGRRSDDGAGRNPLDGGPLDGENNSCKLRFLIVAQGPSSNKVEMEEFPFSPPKSSPGKTKAQTFEERLQTSGIVSISVQI